MLDFEPTSIKKTKEDTKTLIRCYIKKLNYNKKEGLSFKVYFK